ncbi:hypothetical protein JCM11641_004217 [Rhodosporidiobolus odoratus]
MHIKVLSLLLVAFVASTFAITHWERDQLGPRRLDNHKRTPQRVRIGSGRAGGLGRGGPGRTGGGGGPLAGQGGAAGPPAAVGAGAGAGELHLPSSAYIFLRTLCPLTIDFLTAGEAVAAAGGNATDDGAGAATTVTVTETVTATAVANTNDTLAAADNSTVAVVTAGAGAAANDTAAAGSEQAPAATLTVSPQDAATLSTATNMADLPAALAKALENAGMNSKGPIQFVNGTVAAPPAPAPVGTEAATGNGPGGKDQQGA